MKQAFVHKRFGKEALGLLETINEVLVDYAGQGYDLSLRQLYYQLVSRNLVPNTERSYKSIGNLVSDARLAGLVDWSSIVDRGRECVRNPHWEDAEDFLRSAAPQFRLNLWEGQDHYVEVMVEKQALEGVLEPVCREMDVGFTANKGYSSSSALYDAGKRLRNALLDGKEPHVIYLGDHDPSGIDMTRDIADRLMMFVDDDILVDVQRVALNMDQVETFNPPENPAKLTDSRAQSYIRRFGKSSWELDALEPRFLARLVRNAVEDLCDVELFEEQKQKQQDIRDRLSKVAV